MANLKTEIAQLELDVKTYENNLKAATQYVTVNEKVSHVHNAINSYVSTVVSKNNIENTTEISYALGTDTSKEFDPITGNDVETTVHTLYISIPTVSSGVSLEINTTKVLRNGRLFKLQMFIELSIVARQTKRGL